MSRTRENTTEVYINGERKELDQNSKVKEKDFEVNTDARRPLLSGIVNKPVTIKEDFVGASFTGSPAEALAALLKRS